MATELDMATELETSTLETPLNPRLAIPPEPGANVSSNAAIPPGDSSDLQRAPAAVAESPAENPHGDLWRRGIDWPVFSWIAFLHLGAVAAPFFFTWKAFGLFVAMWWLTGGIGICLGYHRLLTHGSFQTYPFLRRIIAVLGSLAGEGSPLMWVATHRKHHAFSDQPGDPHSPHDGRWWSHVLWLFPKHASGGQEAMFRRYAPDLLKDPFMPFLHRTFLLWHWALGFSFFFVGWYFWGALTGWSFVFWGIFLRLVFGLHATWLVNSATHMWGYRNYETTDESRNLWWVALLTYGEGWHNNHHAFQRVARYGHRWWEFDATYYTICLLEKLGMAWKVVDKIPQFRKPLANG